MKRKNSASLMAIILFLLSSCQGACAQTIVENEFLLGTTVLITLMEGGSRSLIAEVFEEVRNIELMMSASVKDYDSTEVLDINKQSKLLTSNNKQTYRISPELFEVVEGALDISEKTHGAFDITIEPLVAVWGWKSDENRIPSQEELNDVLPRINWNTVMLHQEYDTGDNNQGYYSISLRGGQSIDVGGIAKGYAADKARYILEKGGVTQAILDFGGNVLTIGTKKNGQPWKIGIQKPFSQTGEIVLVIHTQETSVVTSGIYERYFESDGIQYSHLINPKDGYPIDNDLTSVTIIAENSMVADGYSTGVFILGLDRGIELVEKTAEIEAIFLTKNNTVHASSGIVDVIEIVDTAYRLIR